MQFTTLGRTGLRVSVAGLGCGGFSRLGQSSGKTEAESVALVRLAIDHGINFIDTAAQYGTETIVGKAIAGLPRDSVVLATKCLTEKDKQAVTPEQLADSIDASLRALGTDHIDLFQLHGVTPARYDHATSLYPTLKQAQEAGKIRFIGITESGSGDPSHEMLLQATADGIWDVGMVAFNMLHRTASDALFPATKAAGVGTLVMHAVRSIFARPDFLAASIRELAALGKAPASLADTTAPLDFLLHEGGAASLTEAAYRFARHSDGVDVVLFGTGSPHHLLANIEALLRPKLPAADLARFFELFGDISGLGLENPGSAPKPPATLPA